MASSRDVDAFVRRLEHRVAHEVTGRPRAALAYSGGLASTLIAMIARKRCALVCVVAGLEGSPDVQAAKAAKLHIDFRVEYAILSRADATRIRPKARASEKVSEVRSVTMSDELRSIAFVRITKGAPVYDVTHR